MAESEKLPILAPNKRHNMKCYACIAAFAVFQMIALLVFGLTVMRIKTPSVRLRSVKIRSLDYCASDNPYFNLTLVAEVVVRNKNFGHFRYDASTAKVLYGGVIVGNGELVKARARARKTRSMNVTIEVNSDGVLFDSAKLINELSSENVTLSASARVRGEVTLMKVMMKKSKTAEMNCSMIVHLPSHLVYDLACK